MNVPENLKYTTDHEWIRIEGEFAYIGISDFAQSELGDIVYVDITGLDETLDKEEIFGSLEAVKTVADLFMPVSGEIVEFNELLEGEPEKVNSDPYGDGWIVKIKLSNLGELDELMDHEAYSSSISA